MGATQTTVWGVHNNNPDIDFVEGGFIALESRLGDLQDLSGDLEALKAALVAAYPNAKAKAIPLWAGAARRFHSVMAIGDLVVHSHKPDLTIAIGRVSGGYQYLPDAPTHRHRRAVEWVRSGIPKTAFSQEALWELGAFLAIFMIKRHSEEFIAIGHGAAPVSPSTSDETSAAEEAVVEEPAAERIEEATRDFVIKTLNEQLDGHAFERFVADLLRAMGYRARVTPPSGDGGVDVLAATDLLGLEPPIIKVQCKKTTGPIDAPVVQQLLGTLVGSGDERGVFVTLGGFSAGARQIARNRHDVRIIDGAELVELVLAHYDGLDPTYRRLLPLRRVYVVDQDLLTG